MHGDTRGPVRVRVCCVPFTLLRLLTLHCTRRRGAAEGEGAQQTERGVADARCAADDPARSPADPGRPGASAHGTGFVATAGVLVGDIAQTPHAAPAGSGSGRPRSSGRNRFGARSAPPPRRPPPAVLPEQPRRARPIPRGPTHRGGGRAAAREGLDGVIPLTATATTGMTLVSSRTVPPPSSGAGRGRLSGADPAQRPRGRAGGPRSRPPRRRVRQPGSLVMSLLVCCRLVM